MAEVPVANPRFSLPTALNLLYGLAVPVSFPGARQQAEKEAPQVSFAGIQVVPDEEQTAMTHLGTPILHPITLEGGTFKAYDHTGKVVDVTLGKLRLPVTSVSEMSSSKTITKTQVSASRSSVKEVFTSGDWEVRISGFLLDEPKHPDHATTIEAMEERLLQFEAVAGSIGVDSDLFRRRGIDRLVIRSINFSQISGKPRKIGYQMQCDSDAPLELLIR